MSVMKNMKNILFALAVISAVFTSTSCSDPSLLGADLFKDEKLNLQFTDTLTINAVNEPADSFVVNTKTTASLDYLLLGNVADPVFGPTEAQIFSQFRYSGAATPTEVATADSFSVYLELYYNSANVYGDTLADQKVSVYRLTEEIPDETLYSSKVFKSESTPIGSMTFKPTPNTTERVITRTIVDTVKYDTTYTAPRIRIPLNMNFAQLLKDTSIFTGGSAFSATGFTKWLKGLVIKVDNKTGCMMAFDFGSTTNPTGIKMYYRKKGDKNESTLSFPSSGLIKYSHFNLDYANGTIQPFLRNQKKADEKLFVQGMSGINVKLEFPYLQSLGKIVINKAELELTAVNEGTNMASFPAVNQLVLRTAQFDAIYDLGLDPAFNRGGGIRPLGTLTTGGGFVRTETVNAVQYKKYYLNLTTHLQEIFKGKQGTTLYLLPLFKEEKGSRVVLFGPKGGTFRSKLNITYTKL